MNIAYILNSTLSNGGATKAFLNMLDGLLQYSIKPFVVIPDNDGIFHELCKRNIHTLVLNYRPSAYPRHQTLQQQLLFLPRLITRIVVNHIAAKKLSLFLKENDIELVHSNTSVIRIGFDAAKKASIPHIYHIREYQDLDFDIQYFPCQKSFWQQLNFHNNYTICITKDIQHHHQQNNKATSKVIYDGVFNSLSAMPTSQDKSYFLFAGRIQPAKGLDQLLEAFKIYADNVPFPMHLKVAGSNCDNAYYHKQVNYIKEHGLTDIVELLGERNDVLPLMRNARALIVPSPSEGFGFCMPEAQQQGCLVIGRNTGGTKEQLDNALYLIGQEIALRYTTTEELAELLQMVGDASPSYYLPMMEQAFKIVNNLYTSERHSKDIYQFYKEILHETNN